MTHSQHTPEISEPIQCASLLSSLHSRVAFLLATNRLRTIDEQERESVEAFTLARANGFQYPEDLLRFLIAQQKQVEAYREREKHVGTQRTPKEITMFGAAHICAKALHHKPHDGLELLEEAQMLDGYVAQLLQDHSEMATALRGLIVAYDEGNAIINDRTDLERNAERVLAARSLLTRLEAGQ